MPDCALDLIIEKDEMENAERYKEDEIVDEMVDYVFAGYDTYYCFRSYLCRKVPDESSRSPNEAA
ncbi:hypothetical protein FRC03_003714 [Tulasnella sp. 419]|nr:hypothetical protein FRC03_003714 [Tulasnella sp. 419]